ncbi:endonuclease YncB(thermonuclease family) [Ochrobactrum daejeonense]|uniref:Endonuclease YncB(Thermonuclease family) n=1 Tax=Brucella daejeonensis TaxID=659015 RepID=A0A7W9ENL9_9HYPH|nr:thermonuclease family protein [Brucella daejeonensis]MBB5703290.1 endonuclease YncB(thermonuclease family) [Brucella daejeonensis]
MAHMRDRSHARAVFGGLACVTGAVLLAAFIAPFHGALDRPVVVIDSGQAGGKQASGGGNGIVVEQFDYDEPGTPSETGNAPQQGHAAPAEGQPPAWKEDGKVNDQVNDGGLEREAPRPPLSDLGLASTPKPPEPPAPAAAVDEGEPMQLLQRPVAVAAGRLESQGRIIELQGIEVVPVEQTCRTASGENWPCGMQARTAFRQWLRSRAIMCRLPQNDSGGAVATECTLGNEDAAEWLAANGWARAAAGGKYEEAGRKAEETRRGIFGDKPDTTLPGPPPDTQSLSPLAPELEPQPSAPPSPPAEPQGDFPPAPPLQ